MKLYLFVIIAVALSVQISAIYGFPSDAADSPKTPESDNDNKREANETNNGQRLTEDAFWLQWLKQQGKQPDGQFSPSESGTPSAHPNENTNGYAIEKSPLAEEFIAKWRKQQGLD